MSLPDRVRLVEVGPRDGLQNESVIVSTEAKATLIGLLADAGLTSIEAGSFVSPKASRQMATTAEVLALVPDRPGVRLSVLVPNSRGLDSALAAGAKEISVFVAASETFSRRNVNCSIAESLERYARMLDVAKRRGLGTRGYVSCALGCPYEGRVEMAQVATVARELYLHGCHEISLADTIGVGTPLQARAMVENVARDIPMQHLAIHFHDTYGQALANIFACLETGVSIIDSSVAGLGGCPYAPGAMGNVATEDVVYMLDGMGIDTGVNLDDLILAGAFITAQLGRDLSSPVGKAFAANQRTSGAVIA
jgi:hydroxymethylglutaryl-CoA lyase